MLLQTFYENEVVQILDPATSIWESAKIISFVSDWCVRIKWVDWSYNKKEDITVPEVYRPEKITGTLENPTILSAKKL